MATINSLICFGGLDGKTVTFTDAGDVVNLTNHGVRPGLACFFQNTGGAPPVGLATNTLYYAKQGADQNKFLLYPTKADAIAGTNQVTFSGTGTGTTVVKSSLVFTGADLSRYDNTRVYDGMTSWNTGRAGASPYDIEVAEVGDAFTDIVSAGIVISVPSAQNIITTKVNGIRSAAFHNGNYPSTTLANMTLDMGYVFLNTGPVSGGGAMLKLNRYRDTADGIVIMNTSSSGVSYGIDLNVQCRSLHNIIVSSVPQTAGMSIVLHGFGLGEIDSGSSLVTYGLARDLDQGETIEQAVASTGIENLFVVDFSAGQRKPTAAEFRRFKRLVAAMQMGGMQFRERKGKKGGIEYWAVREPMIKKAA